MSGCHGCSYSGQSTEIDDAFVGVRIGDATNLTLCRASGRRYARGDRVVVELEQGPTHGWVEKVPMPVFKPCQKSSALELRFADPSDISAFERQQSKERQAKLFALQRSRELGLRLKISRVEVSLDGRSARVDFTADQRVDFRQLVRDLGRRFSFKVRMVQLGSRDEARLLGGIGVCGRTLCCSSWMREFQPISVQMAKRQNLSLNPSKISGQCGRLLCCLAHEDGDYRQRRREPPLTRIEKGSRAS